MPIHKNIGTFEDYTVVYVEEVDRHRPSAHSDFHFVKALCSPDTTYPLELYDEDNKDVTCVRCLQIMLITGRELIAKCIDRETKKLNDFKQRDNEITWKS